MINLNKEELTHLLKSDVSAFNEHVATCPSQKKDFLECVDLSGADLRGADLRGADLRDASLRGANLEGADLRGANLIYAAYLRGVKLRGALIKGVNLVDVIIRCSKLARHKTLWHESHFQDIYMKLDTETIEAIESNTSFICYKIM